MVMPKPIADLDFFVTLKNMTEKYWRICYPDDSMYGLQVQHGTRWCRGLTDDEIGGLEHLLGQRLPSTLRYFYQTMNGLSLPGIDVHASDGRDPSYATYFYSYPEHLTAIQNAIAMAYTTMGLKYEAFFPQKDLPAIFPITYGHFVLTDEPACPVLSIKQGHVLYCADSLCKFLVTECLGDVLENVEDYENEVAPISVKLWLEEGASYKL
ncbi:MAG: SMI1/KNR4 family protein [Chitinophagaceae bacterium]